MPDFQLLDNTNIYQSLLSLALGQPIILLCVPDCESELARGVMRAFAKIHTTFGRRVNLFAITGGTAEANSHCVGDLGLPYPMLADPVQMVISL